MATNIEVGDTVRFKMQYENGDIVVKKGETGKVTSISVYGSLLVEVGGNIIYALRGWWKKVGDFGCFRPATMLIGGFALAVIVVGYGILLLLGGG